jgi:recombinational DNA repair protein RecR
MLYCSACEFISETEVIQTCKSSKNQENIAIRGKKISLYALVLV